MQNIQEIKLIQETREEQLPGFALDFPYIATCAQLDKYPDPFVPWHWHKAVELFYMEEGRLEYETPVNYIIDCRLQEASRMLTTSNLSVTEIAYSCGFGSGSYFSRVFTREKGCTPNEYRSIWQDKTNSRR